MNATKIPKLRTLRDSNPITGQVWVVDASLNLAMADEFIARLTRMWSDKLGATQQEATK